MKRACLLSLAVALILFAATIPAAAAPPESSPVLAAPALAASPAPMVSPAMPAWDPALLATPLLAGSLDPLAWVESATCPPVCAGCPAPCLKSNCHREGNCIHCC
jgi:hypothetical protein